MRDTLYINGVKADMLADSGISLTYQSNIFGDFSAIKQNFSHTITLPKTTHNMALLEGCTEVSSASPFPYLLHSAELYRDDVLLVEDATLYLLASKRNEVEICLVWGAGTINWEKKLNELEQTYKSIELRSDDTPDQPYMYTQSPFFRPKQMNRPCMRVTDILNATEEDITFDFRPWDAGKWALPLLTDKGIMDSYAVDMGAAITTELNQILMRFIAEDNYYFSGNVMMKLPITNASKQGFSVTLENIHDNTLILPTSAQTLTPYTYQGINVLSNKANIHFGGNVVVRGVRPHNTSNIYASSIQVRQNGDTKAQWYVEHYDVRLDASGNTLYDLYFSFDEDVDMVRGNAFIGIYFPADVGFSYNVSSIDSTIAMDAQTQEMEVGETYYLVPNLPDMTIADFVKALCAMSCQFMWMDGNEVHISPYSTLYNNRGNAYDMSSRVIEDTMEQRAELTYKIGNEAQVNHLLYESGEGGTGFDASFIIPHPCLEPSADIVALPFKSYKTFADVAYFPVDTYDDNGVYTFSPNEDAHIGRVATINNTPTFVSSGIKWDDLITNYTEYINILREGKRIAVNIRISALELRGIKFNIPIYLKQYGAYFAISKITTGSNDIASFELIKL